MTGERGVENLQEQYNLLKMENASLKQIIKSKLVDSYDNGSSEIIEEKLKLSKYLSYEDYENLFSKLPALVLVHNNGIIEYANNNATEAIGYVPKDFVGESVLKFIPPEQHQLLIEQMEKRLKGENVKSYEIKIITKSGEIRDFYVNSSEKIKPNEGSIVVVLIDITENKRILSELKESEKKFKTLAESGPYAVLMYQDNNYIYANSAAEKLLDYSFDELKAMKLFDFVDEEFRHIVYDYSQQRQKGEEAPSNYDVKIALRDGQKKWVHVAGCSILHDGKFAGLVAMADITRIKEIEFKLRQNEKRYKNVVQNTPIINFELDEKGFFILLEGKGVEYCGLNKIDIVNSSYLTVFEKYPGVCKKFKEALQGKNQKFIFNYNNIIFEVILNPLLNDNGEVNSCIGVAIDITNRKMNEQKIIHQNEQLVQLNQEKDKFFSIISHDLRSPLHGLLGITKILCEDFSSFSTAEFKDISQNIYYSALNIYKLLDNLLLWSKLKRGMLTYTPQIFELKEIINNNILTVKRKAIDKEIEIEINGDDSLRVYADLHMIDSVIRNLLTNALKFSYRNGKILIEYKKYSADEIIIKVQDFGIGIKKESIPKLFKIDEKINSSGTEGEPSSGLGLILCKEFVEKQKGKIWVESEHGSGSSFYFTLPLFS